MALLNLGKRSRSEERLARIANRIVERTRSEVTRRILGLRADMSNSEARGYIRARAAVVVQREVNLVLGRERRLRPSDRRRLIGMVTDALVNGIFGEGVASGHRVAA